MKLSQNLTIVTPLLIICTPSITKKRKFTEQTDVSKKRKLISDSFEKPATQMKMNRALLQNIVAKNLIIMVMVILEFNVLFYKFTMTNAP